MLSSHPHDLSTVIYVTGTLKRYLHINAQLFNYNYLCYLKMILILHVNSKFVTLRKDVKFNKIIISDEVIKVSVDHRWGTVQIVGTKQYFFFNRWLSTLAQMLPWKSWKPHKNN